MNKLTPKQKLFCEQYIIDFNGTRAYGEVYPDSSKEASRKHVNRLVSNGVIQKYIKQLVKPKLNKLGITQDYVLKGIKKHAENAKKISANGKQTDDSAIQLKALELLGKYLKLFEDGEKDTTNNTINGAVININILKDDRDKS